MNDRASPVTVILLGMKTNQADFRRRGSVDRRDSLGVVGSDSSAAMSAVANAPAKALASAGFRRSNPSSFPGMAKDRAHHLEGRTPTDPEVAGRCRTK